MLEYAVWNYDTRMQDYVWAESPPEGWDGWLVSRDEDGNFLGLVRQEECKEKHHAI